MRQYAAALEPASNIGASGRTTPGSFNALVVSYYRTDFRRLKPSTQRLWRNIIEREIRSKHGSKPVARLERKHVKDIIGAKAMTPQAANNLLKVLRVLLNHGVEIGMIANNPATWREALQEPRRRLPHVDRERDRPPRGTSPGRHEGAARVCALALHDTTAQRCGSLRLAAFTGRRHRAAAGEDRYAAADSDSSRLGGRAGSGAAKQSDIFGERARKTLHATELWQLVPRALQ